MSANTKSDTRKDAGASGSAERGYEAMTPGLETPYILGSIVFEAL